MRGWVAVVASFVLECGPTADAACALPAPGEPARGVQASDSLALGSADSTTAGAGPAAAADTSDAGDRSSRAAEPPDSLRARIQRLERIAPSLDATARLVLRELLDAARELLADGDAEAASIVLEDAVALAPKQHP